MLYAADVWAGTTRGTGDEKKGSAKATKHLTTVQRAGAIAITGGLRTSPTDTLDACAHLLPAAHLIDKWLHRSTIWIATLPKGHPLSKIAANKNTCKVK